jgi:hypothetical protein
MKYMLMCWGEDSAEVTVEEGAAMATAHPVAGAGTVEVRPLGDFPGDE